MLPTAKIEAVERHSLENANASFRHLDAMTEQVKRMPPGFERDLELKNISLLKERIGKDVFNQPTKGASYEVNQKPGVTRDIETAENAIACSDCRKSGMRASAQIGNDQTPGEISLEQIKNRHGGMPPIEQ